MTEPCLFVYGTLRPGFDGPMADWLKGVACHVGGATAQGWLYRVDGYPAFVPGGSGMVKGDLFLLPDAAAILAVLDEHEECADHFPSPHEYRRARLTVRGGDGPIEVWTYIYNRDVSALERIESGDFLA
ncbi:MULTISPECIES: gamma-glutamylcyclotransferase family protein [Sphingobium]|uniref:gamma-glutamylcyclotransferase family protein n=1 Tax=Sphingobium TaxID=165695 RepID=UPI0018D4EDB0|nr:MULTISPECIES: gamma-glutamylcyclotransferase family protein [Sphingobium]